MLLFHVRQRQSSQEHEYYKEMPYVCDAYYVWRDRVTKAEIRILRALSFEVQPVVLPTSLLGSYLKALELHECQSIAQASMNYVNDAAGSWAYAKYSLPSIICASIQLAVDSSSITSIVLPDQWYRVFDVDDIQSVMNEILSVYSDQTRLDSSLDRGGDTCIHYSLVGRDTRKPHHHQHLSTPPNVLVGINSNNKLGFDFLFAGVA